MINLKNLLIATNWSVVIDALNAFTGHTVARWKYAFYVFSCFIILSLSFNTLLFNLIEYVKHKYKHQVLEKTRNQKILLPRLNFRKIIEKVYFLLRKFADFLSIYLDILLSRSIFKVYDKIPRILVLIFKFQSRTIQSPKCIV